MKRWMFLLVSLLSLGICLICLVMTILAAEYLEWGRVLAYGLGTILGGECFVLFLMKFRNGGRDTESFC